jgi:hypothetical protein
MIALVGASIIYLTALQATINAPTTAFRACLKQATEKAKGEKVAADAFEAYIRNSCSAQGDTLKTAVIGFRTKNGMTKKAAADDAAMTLDDYVLTAVDNYKFLADFNKPQQAPAAAATPVATPASAPQPPKQ